MNFMNVYLVHDYMQHDFRPGGVAYDLPIKLLEDIISLYKLHSLIEYHDIEELLTNNRICKVD